MTTESTTSHDAYATLVTRAIKAPDADHARARDTVRCAMCGMEPGHECVFGHGTAGAFYARTFPGRVHTRRLTTMYAREAQ